MISIDTANEIIRQTNSLLKIENSLAQVHDAKCFFEVIYDDDSKNRYYVSPQYAEKILEASVSFKEKLLMRLNKKALEEAQDA